MVRIVPNYSSIVATVLAVEVSGTDPAMDIVTLQVSKLEDHEQYPNLVRLLPDSRLQVTIKRSTRETLGLKKDTKVSALVRAAGGSRYYFNDDSIKVVS